MFLMTMNTNGPLLSDLSHILIVKEATMSRPRRSLPVKDYGENEDCEVSISKWLNITSLSLAY